MISVRAFQYTRTYCLEKKIFHTTISKFYSVLQKWRKGMLEWKKRIDETYL